MIIGVEDLLLEFGNGNKKVGIMVDILARLNFSLASNFRMCNEHQHCSLEVGSHEK
jgi:hypothetical protein